MADLFLNKKVDLTSTDNTSLYTVPTSTVTVVRSILVSNDDASNACEITVTLLNSSDTVFSLFKQKDIGAKLTVELLTNTLVLNEDEEFGDEEEFSYEQETKDETLARNWFIG